MWRGKIFAATALTVAVLGSTGACSLWPSLENKLRRDFELMASGRDANETEAVGRADWICFNQAINSFIVANSFQSPRGWAMHSRSLSKYAVSRTVAVAKAVISAEQSVSLRAARFVASKSTVSTSI